MPGVTAVIPGFTGQVITAGHERYDELRSIWNVMHDRRPAVIARCEKAADVAAAIAYARRHDLVIAVRGGGHSLPGFGTCDDGLVVDLRPMNKVTVDPAARGATVGGGALLGDVDRATQEHGLVVPAGVISHTGVAGLTLGGGVGRLMRRFGLTIDSLRSAEVVTADGRVLRAAQDRHPDLFWAIRGGGGNFGVVTEFEFALHELPARALTLLSCYHDLADAHRVLRLAQQVMSADPADELLWTSFARKAPPRPWMPSGLAERPGIMSVIEWSGDQRPGQDDGYRLLGELRAELRPLASDLGVVPFGQVQSEGDEFFGPGLLSYVKATFADELTDELIDVVSARGALIGSEVSQIELLSMGGAIGRVSPDATAFPHRTASWLVNIPASWRSEAETAAEIGWVRDSYAALTPYCRGGGYVNFMDRDEQAGEQAAYGPTLRRLQAVKADYDPDNVFRLNQNIIPLSQSAAPDGQVATSGAGGRQVAAS
jgi:FAD/FMN-containing dehydrogenase